MRFLFFVLTALFFNTALSAQNITIELKNGNSIKGKMIEMKSDDYTDVEISPGNVVRIDAADIKSFQMSSDNPPAENPPSPPRADKIPLEEEALRSDVRQKGLYHYTAARFALGTSEFNQFNQFGPQRRVLLGLGLSHETGYRFGPRFDLGMGFGVNWIAARRMVPLFATARVYFSDEPLTGFISLSAGGNFAMASNSNNWNSFTIIEKAYHGFYVYPAMGLQIPLRNGFKYIVDLGYSAQSAAFDFIETNFQGQTVSSGYESAIFNRLSLRIGLMF